MDARPYLAASSNEPGVWRAVGDWRLTNAAALTADLAALSGTGSRLDGSDISALDSVGALLLLDAAGTLGIQQQKIDLQEAHRSLLDAVAQAGQAPAPAPEPAPGILLRLLDESGRTVSTALSNVRQLLGFLGLTVIRAGGGLQQPRLIPMTAVVHHMEQTGLNALPLVCLLSFLIGAVIAFLGATVLRDFGAELFVIDLTSYAFMREFGVMLTAILLAGRTASAFTAQIGTMKSREEIDAMRTIGLNPIDLLVLPRLLALLLMLPLLSVMATLAGILGGMLVAWGSLDIVPDLFLNHLHETIELRHYLVGIGKAPIFAVVIALVGCLEGFKVTGTAQSVGERTTSAVVQAITLVILIDACAAIFFMEMGW